MPKRTTPDRSEHARAQLRALIAASEHFNSDQTYVIARDNDDSVLGVAVVTFGDDAKALAAWLERRKFTDWLDKPAAGARKKRGKRA